MANWRAGFTLSANPTARIKQAAPNRKQPARRAPPPPKNIVVTGTTGSTFAVLPSVFASVQAPLNPAPADAAQLANRAVLEGRNIEIVPAGEVNSIDLATNLSAPGQATSMTAGQNVSA
jgi:hypothetical protein